MSHTIRSSRLRLVHLLFASIAISILLAGLFATGRLSAAVNFTPGNLALLVAAASANNTTGSIVEVSSTTPGQTGNAIQSIAIPGTGTDAYRMSGSATSTGYVSSSDDRMRLTIMGANYAGMHGELTAAFTLGQIHADDIVFLKVPDLNPRVPGTDLVAVYQGDKVWMIDNKAYSQSLVDKVTALTGSFPKNLSDDAVSFAEHPKLGRRGDPVIGDAVARLEKASAEIQRVTKDLDTKEIAAPAVQARIDVICRDNGIERVVTNAGGMVAKISEAIDAAGVVLKDLGITRKPGRP
jgi:hypothetical protein